MAWKGACLFLLWLWPIISVGDLSNAVFKIQPAFFFLGKSEACKSSIIFTLSSHFSFDLCSKLLLGVVCIADDSESKSAAGLLFYI